MSAISQRILYYDAKIKAIDDCLAILKTNEAMALSESLKIIRKLSKKQFNAIVKKGKLI
jgi:hypothetical protein